MPHFKQIYIDAKIHLEAPLFNRKRIDFLIEQKDKNTLVEVKTNASPLLSIRFAIGQLLEYSFFLPNTKENVFLIITHVQLGDDEKRYLNYIRAKLRINVQYLYFDLLRNTLNEKQ